MKIAVFPKGYEFPEYEELLNFVKNLNDVDVVEHPQQADVLLVCIFNSKGSEHWSPVEDAIRTEKGVVVVYHDVPFGDDEELYAKIARMAMTIRGKGYPGVILVNYNEYEYDNPHTIVQHCREALKENATQ